MRCVWFHVIYHVFYSKFVWSVLYLYHIWSHNFCTRDSILFTLIFVHVLYSIFSILFFISIFCCVRFVSWSWNDHEYIYTYCRDDVHCHSHTQCHIVNSKLILHKLCFRFYSRVGSRLSYSRCSFFYSIFCFICYLIFLLHSTRAILFILRYGAWPTPRPRHRLWLHLRLWPWLWLWL